MRYRSLHQRMIQTLFLDLQSGVTCPPLSCLLTLIWFFLRERWAIVYLQVLGWAGCSSNLGGTIREFVGVEWSGALQEREKCVV